MTSDAKEKQENYTFLDGKHHFEEGCENIIFTESQKQH